MRKITEQSVAAFLAGRKFKSGNMEVDVDTFAAEVEMRLHGHLIARKVARLDLGSVGGQTPDQIIIEDCGWQTSTTKDRLNGLLRELTGGHYSIYQKDHTWYLHSASAGSFRWHGGARFTLTGEYLGSLDC